MKHKSTLKFGDIVSIPMCYAHGENSAKEHGKIVGIILKLFGHAKFFEKESFEIYPLSSLCKKYNCSSKRGCLWMDHRMTLISTGTKYDE